MNARALCRQHGAPYLRPSARRERLLNVGATALLAAALVLPGALIDTEEDAMNVNLNSPAIEQGPLTADELAAYSRARLAAAWADPDELPSPLFSAECCTEIGSEVQGQQRDGWLTRAWLRLRRALG